MQKVLATDLDGTLFYPQRKMTMIPHRNVAFIRRFIKAGGKVVLCTSRNREYTERVIAKIGYPLDVVGGNGTYIIADGQVMKDMSLDNKIATEIFQYLDKNVPVRAWMIQTRDHGIVLYVKEISFFLRMFYQVYYAAQGIYRQPYTFGNRLFRRELKKGQLYSLILYFGAHKGADENAKTINYYIRDHYPSVESSWTQKIIEITPAECSKGLALKKYCDAKGIAYGDVYVVGDSGNDISMFKNFEHSYVMNHAAPSVKKYAKHIIRRFPEMEAYLQEEKD